MGRRHLIRFAPVVAAIVLAVVPAALAAGATAPIGFKLFGATEPSGAQAPHAYLAASRSATAPWLRRLTATHRTRVAAVDFKRYAVFAGFLDGAPCAANVRLNGWTIVGKRLTVMVQYTRPPIGVAACVRTSVPYLVMEFARSGFRSLPTIVELRASARA